MIIKEFEIYAIHLPLKQPFIVSYATYNHMPSVIVKLIADNGLVGYGEAVPDEHVTGETYMATFEVLKHVLLPAVKQQNPFDLEKIHHIMDSAIVGNPAAKAAIDIACYDLMGKYVRKPIYDLLGGKFHDTLTFPKVLSIDEPEIMAEKAQEAMELGYSSLKIKVGGDIQSDINRIAAVRERVGHQVPIRVDVNQGWQTYTNALFGVKALEPYHLSWIEQPIRMGDIDGLAALKEKTTIPIMADESIHHGLHLQEIIKKNAADVINIKLMKCGGIYPAIHLAKMAEFAGIGCQIGSMVESSIGSAAGYHTAISRKNITSTELTGPLLFSQDIGDLEYALPYVHLSGEPGLGIKINEDVLEQLTIKKEQVL
ncbi:dipeptide epimerase [Lysinibacillus endophyticus]|uniref:mandelate racemase/muconate lactonizing enzyme family protein n=1 Tax=Ureibacillus endophyticus TaxID=1978490 RepID=UPI0020A0E09A|nr:dipeptide epimerase [Lysinibacillus endophyticus]MCP1146435.1 dipeptide epimerase [Lysinibacillus endophyticus]